jgi:signal transduction histidine kinase
MAPRPNTILLVDSQAARRKALGRLLSVAGFRVVQASGTRGVPAQVRRFAPGLIIARPGKSPARDLAWRLPLLERGRGMVPRVWVLVPAAASSAVRPFLAPTDQVSPPPSEPEALVARARALLKGGEALLTRADARDRLLQMEVHDLKTPLGNIVNLCDLLLGGDVEEERRKEFLTAISDNAKAMLKLVMNLLNVAALESGWLVPHREPLQPADLVQGAESQIGWLLRRRRAQLELRVPPGLPTVSGDRDLLVRLLVNLLDNAVQHGGENSRLAVEARAEGEGLRFDVLDRGPGVREELRERIFDPFFRLGPGEGMTYSTGLGLAFCRLVADTHGGRIWVEEREGGGSRFSVWLPAEPAGNEAAAATLN